MKIILYANKRHDLLIQALPALARSGIEVLPFHLYEVASRLDPENLYNELSLLWDRILGSEKYDALWSYAIADELCIRKCRQYDVPVLIQEFYGHFPESLPAILPLDCDYENFYADTIHEAAAGPGKTGKAPLITLALASARYPAHDTIDRFMKVYDGKTFLLDPYWTPSEVLRNARSFTETVCGIFEESSELEDCLLKIRLHPELEKLMQPVRDFMESNKNPRISLDTDTMEESLRNSDIVINVNSSYGFDALKAACEVITYEGRAFYSNPQLTYSPRTPAELHDSLLKLSGRIRKHGKQQKPFMAPLLGDLKDKLKSPCVEPYDIEQMKKSLSAAAKMPLIRNVNIENNY